MCIPVNVLLFLAKIVEIDVAEVGTQNNEICSCGPDRPGSSPVDDNFFLFFLTFWYVMHYFSFSCSDFEKSGKIDVQKCKILRLSFLVSRPWRGPLRHVSGHTNHRATMIHTFWENPSSLDVHPRIRFSIFKKKNIRRNCRPKVHYVMLTKESIALRLRANY